MRIDEHPAVVDARFLFWDWELNNIVGREGKGTIVTLEERTTMKMLTARSPKGKNAKAVAKLVVQMLPPFETHVFTITTDNGTGLMYTSTSHKFSKPKYSSHTAIPLGEKASSKTPTNSSKNTSQKILIPTPSLTIKTSSC